MSSKIRQELVAVTGLTIAGTETEAEFVERVVRAVGKDISDSAWESLSGPAQDWNNLAADAMTRHEPLPAFPDEVADEPAAVAPTARRRGAAAAAAEQPAAPYEPKEGDEITVTTKRGKVVTGFVVSLADGMLYLNADANGPEADDQEFALANLVKVERAASAAAVEEVRAAEVTAAPPAIGDTVEVVTARGKTIVGNVTETSADELVLTTASGGIEELMTKNLKTVTVKVRAAAATAPAAAEPTKPAGRTRGAAAPAAAATEADRPTRSVNAPGVTLGGRIRELVCADPAMTQEAVSARLTAEKINFRDQSVKMIISDTVRVIDELKKLGWSKK